MKTILLLTNRVSTKYLVRALVPTWHEMGYRVIEHAGLLHLPNADVIFLHVDETVVAPEYAFACKRYPASINAGALDISRRRYSGALLSPGDDYAGPVIVKTDANYGGIPEHRQHWRRGDVWTKVRTFAGQMLRAPPHPAMSAADSRWERLERIWPQEYPRFDSVRDVPPGVWKNPKLIVERFLPERENDIFYIRYWTFFGSRQMSGRYGSHEPVVKFGNRVTPDTPVEVPPALRRWRDELGMDYGRFDYVMHDGSPVLLDVNKTMGGGESLQGYTKVFSELATGIEDFVQ